VDVDITGRGPSGFACASHRNVAGRSLRGAAVTRNAYVAGRGYCVVATPKENVAANGLDVGVARVCRNVHICSFCFHQVALADCKEPRNALHADLAAVNDLHGAAVTCVNCPKVGSIENQRQCRLLWLCLRWRQCRVLHMPGHGFDRGCHLCRHHAAVMQAQFFDSPGCLNTVATTGQTQCLNARNWSHVSTRTEAHEMDTLPTRSTSGRATSNGFLPKISSRLTSV